jgi:hypothetical protein
LNNVCKQQKDLKFISKSNFGILSVVASKKKITLSHFCQLEEEKLHSVIELAFSVKFVCFISQNYNYLPLYGKDNIFLFVNKYGKFKISS